MKEREKNKMSIQIFMKGTNHDKNYRMYLCLNRHLVCAFFSVDDHSNRILACLFMLAFTFD